MNFPGQERAHWYIDVFPRMTSIAGFELATGTFIDIIDPAAAARRLR
jgi:UDPglucose--hexose-1-phosphate uridylyltransferase